MRSVDNKRGGRRPGSGPKAKDGATLATTIPISARIWPDQHGPWLAIGGSAWLRTAIAEALAKLRGEQ